MLIDALLLCGSLAALAAAGWRAAGTAVPAGLLRVLAAVALATAAAAASTLGLGLAGLGADPVALTAASVALWLVTLRVVAASGPSAGRQLAAWWWRLSPAGRAARAALAGACVGYGIWVLRHPVLGLDALTDHLALPVDWVHNGRPGSLVAVNEQLPYANYPNTYELLITWAVGLARTLVPAVLMTPATLILLAVSVRTGLAELDVPARVAWLAAAALATLPLVVVQLPGPNTDLPAMAWLGASAALVAGARRRPGLLAVAVVAAGVAAGIKTTVIPLAVLALVLGGWSCRARLRGLARPLLASVAIALVTGGIWYLRNLIDHGAPLWPLSTTPWGDPIPPAFHAIHASLLSHPGATLGGRLGAYGRALAGGLVLLAGAALAPLWTRRAATTGAAVIVLAAWLAWAAAPYTGIATNTTLAVGATRYLLAGVLAAGVTVAIAGRYAPWPPVLVLALALGVNLDRDLGLAFPAAPSPSSLLLAAAVGAAAGLAAEAIGPRRPRRRRQTVPARLTHGGVAVLTAGAIAGSLAALALPVNGFMPGHAGAGLFDAGVVRWLQGRSSFRHGNQPVAIGPVEIAVLTGARLAHPVTLLGEAESCPAVRRRAHRGWVVIQTAAATETGAERWLGCLAGRRPAYTDTGLVVYAPRALTVPAS